MPQSQTQKAKEQDFIKQAIIAYEHRYGVCTDRRVISTISYDPITTLWSFRNQEYPSLFKLIAANRPLVLSTKDVSKPQRRRDPEIILIEQQLSIRIYKYGVTRTPTGWKCRDEDQISYIHAPTLRALLELAPHCYISTYKEPPVSKQTKMPTLKDVVAEIKAQKAENLALST